jgi:hypothetical protein
LFCALVELEKQHQQSDLTNERSKFTGAQLIVGSMGDRLLTVTAVVFGIVIPISFLVIAWLSL